MYQFREGIYSPVGFNLSIRCRDRDGNMINVFARTQRGSVKTVQTI